MSDELEIFFDEGGSVHFDVPRGEWPPGPWKDEPDRLEWRTKVGYHALMRRQQWGAWCAYVAVPPGHPFHGMAAEDLGERVEVHGGVNWSAPCNETVCHMPPPGEPDDVWWIGFDCAHGYDYFPGRPRFPGIPDDLFGPSDFAHYRDVAYVRAQCEALALQLRDAAR